MSYTIKQLADQMCVQPQDVVNRLKATGHLGSVEYLELLNSHEAELDTPVAAEVVQLFGFRINLHQDGNFTIQDPTVQAVTRVSGGQIDHGKMKLTEVYRKAGNTSRNVTRESVLVRLPPNTHGMPPNTQNNWRLRRST